MLYSVVFDDVCHCAIVLNNVDWMVMGLMLDIVGLCWMVLNSVE